jgi:integrase
VASIHRQTNTLGTTWRVRWREDGRQQSLSFETENGAERFAQNVDSYGPVEAKRILEVEEKTHAGVTVTEYLGQYIESLTGIQPATANRYRRYVSKDITEVFGSMPLTAVTEDTVGRWVKQMTGSAKTVQNKHGFLSGAFSAAVRKGLIPANPCEGRRLPEGEEAEQVHLTPAEFQLLHDCLPAKWRPLAFWLVSTGMRFSEATALQPKDIDITKRTVRVNKAWKYASARGDLKIGPPKTKKSNRTITVNPAELAVLKLDGEWCFTNGAGNPIRAQEFFNQGWKPAREKAQTLGLEKAPRVHDLRHTHASWLINAGVPLPVVQARLGHENITTTIGMYYHVDQRAEQQAAATVRHILSAPLTEIAKHT